jgi:hypothetical protein
MVVAETRLGLKESRRKGTTAPPRMRGGEATMKRSSSKAYACLLGAFVVGGGSLLFACADDASSPLTNPDNGGNPGPSGNDAGSADSSSTIDAAPPPPNSTAGVCPTGALCCDNFDQADRVGPIGAWNVFNGDPANFTITTATATSQPKALRVTRAVDKGASLERTFTPTKAKIVIDLDFDIMGEASAISAVPPLVVDVLPHPDGFAGNMFAITQRSSAIAFETDDGTQPTNSAEVDAPLYQWNHVHLVIQRTGVPNVTGTMNVNGLGDKTFTLPSTTADSVSVRIGSLYDVALNSDGVSVLVDSVVITEE